jgi:hypothetical protein
MTLLSHTSWFYKLNNYGCHKCSAFLDRSNSAPFPVQTADLANSKILADENREQMMAYMLYLTFKDPQHTKKFKEDKTNFLLI